MHVYCKSSVPKGSNKCIIFPWCILVYALMIFHIEDIILGISATSICVLL